MTTTTKNKGFNHYWVAIAGLMLVMVMMGVKQCHSQINETIKKSVLATKQHDRRNFAIKCGMMLLAGACDGTAETLKFHYSRFQNRIPQNEQFWNPSLSWRNKYKNGDPAQGAAYFGSTTFLVGTTDGYHLSQTMRNMFVVAGVSIPLYGKRPWYDYLLQAVCYYASYTYWVQPGI